MAGDESAVTVTSKQVAHTGERFVGRRIRITGCTTVEPTNLFNGIIEMFYAGQEDCLPPGGWLVLTFFDAKGNNDLNAWAAADAFADTIFGLDEDAKVTLEGTVQQIEVEEILHKEYVLIVEKILAEGGFTQPSW
jgi:hypothetical protein